MVGGFQAHATDVGGIIDTDTTWNLAGSPYTITSQVQIANGVTLTIEPGVVVNRINNGEIWLYGGKLLAIGTADSNIVLDKLYIANQTETNSEIHIQHCILYSPYLYLRWAESFSLLDSLVEKSSGTSNAIEICPLNNDSYIERNIFTGNGTSNFIFINENVVYNGNLYIKNNVFYGYNNFAIFGNSDNIVQFNSFLNTDRNAVTIAAESTDWTVAENYWNTTDTDIIDGMINDRNDYLSREGYVIYNPILTEPHSGTPVFTDNQPPIAKCGSDRVVFDSVPLDGYASTDPEGSDLTYYWTLRHKTNPAYNQDATGVNPTVTRLMKGFYNLCLQVTDDNGATDIDCCLLAAAGSCSCAPSSIHVESITPSLVRGSKGQSFGQVTVLVADDCGNPVTSVDVTGTLSSDYFNEELNGVTGADGTVILTTTKEAKKLTYSFCVDDLSNTFPYVPSDNVENCDSLN